MNSAFQSDEWTRRRFMEGTAKTFLGVGALGMAGRSQAALGPNLGLSGRAGAAKHVIDWRTAIAVLGIARATASDAPTRRSTRLPAEYGGGAP